MSAQSTSIPHLGDARFFAKDTINTLPLSRQKTISIKEAIVKISEALLLVLPAVVLFGHIIYLENIHAGVSKGRSITLCCINIGMFASFFILIYVLKFVILWT
jgi:hypothetical protein